ncbi:MAG: MATE family efflux transporter [candidate division Zixibacteria bacterium]|nr:MATE family efflux transporter [candidate division Zixibacteria bacterium]
MRSDRDRFTDEFGHLSPAKTPPKYDLTEGSIFGSIFKMGLPSMIGFAAVNLYDVVDMFWVAKLGPENVAAITIFFSFYWVISSANQIAGTGSVALISRRYGEKDFPATEAAIKEAILLKWMLAIFFGILGYIFIRQILALLGAETNVLQLSIEYGIIQLYGLGVSFAVFTIYTALRGVGDPNKAMGLMIAGVVLNMALDPFLIFGWWIFPEMGIRGAALASVISRSFAFIVGLVIFYGGFTSVRLHLKGQMRVSMLRIWQMIKIGFPSGINSISFSLSRLVIMPMVTVFGTNVVAAYGVGMRVTAMAIMIVVGMGLGVSALTGQNLGAKKFDRAKETAYKSILFTAAVMTGFSLFFILGADFIVKFFFDTEPLVSLGKEVIRILAMTLPAIGIAKVIEMIYAGAGDNKPSMVFSLIYSWILLIPAILITTKLLDFDHTAVWWSMVFSGYAGTVLFFMYFKREKWLEKLI